MAPNPLSCDQQWVIDLIDRELRAIREVITIRETANETALTLVQRTLEVRLHTLENEQRALRTSNDQIGGALNLIRFGGLAGVLALVGVIAEIIIAMLNR